MTYKDFAIEFAKEAGDIIKKNFISGMKTEWKKNLTPVTETDFVINKMLIEKVRRLFPDHGVCGEEECSYKNTHEYLWVCDPVDGTIPFSHGIPIATFSLALVKNGQPILGAVFNPFGNQLFYAEKGKGAFVNGNKIKVSENSSIEKSVIVVEMLKRASRYYNPQLKNKLEDLSAITLTLRSGIYGGMLVARGNILAAIFGARGAYDVAAVKIIVEEAGGKVTDLFGNEQNYIDEINGALITNGKVHDQLLKLVQEGLIKNTNLNK